MSEVVLSVQFEPLAGLSAAHMGLLWSRFRERFPTVEQQPPLPPVRPENLSGLPPGVELTVQMGSGPLTPRLFFISEDATELVQVQGDRFVANWRRVRRDDVYPRYPHVRAYFNESFAAFRDFVREEELGEIRLVQYEVIYLNEIRAGEGWDRFGEISRVLSFWGTQYAEPPLTEPEAASAALQYLIPSREEPTGRLYVDVRPARAQPEGRPFFAVNLTARIIATSVDEVDELPGLDLAREHIVQSFAVLTSGEMHAIWGRIDA